MINTHWFSLLNKELDGTSDRSCIIVAASIIDHLLLETLKTFLAPSSQAQDSLFDVPNAPLGTFSSRIDMACRLGLISAKAGRDLHIIRKMRNDQAHSIQGLSFSEISLSDKVSHLVKSLDVRGRASSLLKPPYDTVRGHFIVVALIVIVHLDDLRNALPSLKALESDSLYTTVWSEESDAGG